jgi:hypothetical protein
MEPRRTDQRDTDASPASPPGLVTQGGDEYVEDLDSYRPKIRQDASKYILDKSIPQQPTTQVNIQNNVMGMADFVAAIKQRRNERTNVSSDEQPNGATTGQPVGQEAGA